MNWVRFIAGALGAGLYGTLFAFYTYAMNILNSPNDLLGTALDLMICLSLMGSSVICGVYALLHRPFSVWKSDREMRP